MHKQIALCLLRPLLDISMEQEERLFKYWPWLQVIFGSVPGPLPGTSLGTTGLKCVTKSRLR